MNVLSILGYNTIYFIPFGCTHPISTMTRFRRSFASKSFGLSDRARIRDDDKFHAACLLACTDRNFLGEKERREDGKGDPGNGHRSSTVRELEFTDTSRSVLIFISCPASFLQAPLRRHVSPFVRVLTRPKDDSTRIIDSISSETYRRDVSRGYGNTRPAKTNG